MALEQTDFTASKTFKAPIALTEAVKAGILNDKKNILGMMPHPERMIDNLISNEDGIGLFTSILS